MKKILIAKLIIATIIVLATNLSAGAPQFIPIEGYLPEPGGNPINGETVVELSVYDSRTDGTRLWHESQLISVEEGYFVAYPSDARLLNLFPSCDELMSFVRKQNNKRNSEE